MNESKKECYRNSNLCHNPKRIQLDGSFMKKWKQEETGGECGGEAPCKHAERAWRLEYQLAAAEVRLENMLEIKARLSSMIADLLDYVESYEEEE